MFVLCFVAALNVVEKLQFCNVDTTKELNLLKFFNVSMLTFSHSNFQF